MSSRELGNPLGNPLALRPNVYNTLPPDLIIRRTSGSGTLIIPEGYRTRRVTLIAPGGYGSNGLSTKGGDSGQAGGSAQTFKAPVSEKQVLFTINYTGTSTASVDGISMSATLGAGNGIAPAGGASITAGKGVAFTGSLSNIGQTGVSSTVTSDGAPSALPGITGYSLGGGGAGGGGYGAFFGVAGIEQEGALPATSATGTGSAAGGNGNDIIINGQRKGSLGGIIVELWRN